eukprot:4061096-Amphidinium_carterae.1
MSHWTHQPHCLRFMDSRHPANLCHARPVKGCADDQTSSYSSKLPMPPNPGDLVTYGNMVSCQLCTQAENKVDNVLNVVIYCSVLKAFAL